MSLTVRTFSSIFSVLVFVIVIFGGPIYEVFHENWPGRGIEVFKLTFEKVRSGSTARRIENRLRRDSTLKKITRPTFNEFRYLATGATNPEVVVGQDKWLFVSHRLMEPSKEAWELMPEIVKTLGELTRYLESRGVLVVFELVPRKQTLHPDKLPKDLPFNYFPTYEPVLEQMRAEGLNVPDLRPALAGTDPLFFLTNDPHWNSEGCHVAAKVIADFITQNVPGGRVPGTPLETKFYRMPQVERYGYGQMLLGFRQGSWLDRQFTNNTSVVYAGRASSQDDWLAGSTEPEPILVIGTSMSAAPYFTTSQLIGWLGVNIEDHSKPGYTAGYRAVEKFKQFLTGERPLPKVLVWEIPEDFIAMEGRYLLEPLASIQAILGDAPFNETRINFDRLELSGLTGKFTETGFFTGQSVGRKASIKLDIPRPIEASMGVVLKFEITIPVSSEGAQAGNLTVEWGSKSQKKEWRKKKILLKVSDLMHPILIPLEVGKGETFDSIIIRPLDLPATIKFGRFQILTKK